MNMIASENVSSPSLRKIVASDLMHRYGEYEKHDLESRWDEDNALIIEIERTVRNLARDLFDVEYVDLRPISGHLAILSCICAFARPRTTVFEIAGFDGGHEWSSFAGNIPIVNYRPEFYPFDSKDWNIDVDAAANKIRKKKPSVLIFGSSFYLFPNPIRELRSVAAEVGATIVCDEAHVLGLIAGKQWPNPLREGGHVMSGSTHKSFPGPQKGIVMTNSTKHANKIANAIYPSLLTNHHLMNVAALGYALAEMLNWGKKYARQTVKNAKSFGAALVEEGFDVVAEHRGFTQSHQVLIRTDKRLPGRKAAKLLEKANIITNKMELRNANGIRTGTSELTRIGMQEAEMKEVAHFYREVLLERKDPQEVARHVRSFVSRFGKICYSFDEGKNPYALARTGGF